MNSWKFERDDDWIRICRTPRGAGPTLTLETPTHRTTLEFGTLLELHEFQSAFERHLARSGWNLVGFSRRRRVVTGD
jgi:hypothetical protein